MDFICIYLISDIKSVVQINTAVITIPPVSSNHAFNRLIRIFIIFLWELMTNSSACHKTDIKT